MKFRYCWLLLAVLIWTGCGKKERQEATTLVKMLQEKQADLVAINALEKDLFGSTKSWCEGIIANGGGKDKALQENAASAKALAQSAGVISTQLGQLKQAFYDHKLTEEYPETVRGNVLAQLMKRQKMLQELRMELDGVAASFETYGQSRDYKNDSYPPDIDKLHTKLTNYSGPDDSLNNAIKELKEKYTITDADVAAKT